LAAQSGFYFTRLKYSVVPATSRSFDHEFGKLFEVPAPSKFPAWLSWLCDFQDDIVNLKLIANANGRLVQSCYSKVLAKHPARDRTPIEFRLPSRKMIRRVGKYRFVDTPVMKLVGLSITIDTGCSDVDPTVDWRFVESSRPGAFEFVRANNTVFSSSMIQELINRN